MALSEKDYPVKVGTFLFTMVEPHAGHEVAYNRWYEHDHFYSGCLMGPNVFAGDRFVATAAESRALRAELREALAVDMESGAVAQVCHDYSIPFCAVRTISDRADDAAHVDFPAFLQRVARHYSDRMIETALRLL